MKLRLYQAEGTAATINGWQEHQTGLVVSPTGTGKTEMFCEMIRLAIADGKRCLVLVDRINLVVQTAKRIKDRLGFWPDREQGDMYAVTRGVNAAKCVVATIQSLRSGKGRKRYERFNPKDFDYVLIDEAHLTITPSTIKTVEHFTRGNPDLRMCGYTATPKRQDGQSLAQLYETVFFQYEIRKAIKDGWLVPVVAKTVHVESVSLKSLPNRTRDWSDREIGEVMENQQAILETVGVLRKETRGRRTIVFCARVAHAELVSAYLNRDTPGCARVIHGGTPEDERKQILNAYENGEVQYLCNCAVLTTGFDSPGIEVVAMCRPTKSWSLFTQCVGRGLRPLPGVVDQHDTPEARCTAIAASDKPHVTVLSFVGRESAMNLVGPTDVLAGDMVPPEVAEKAKELEEEAEGETDTLELLEEAEEEVERLRIERQCAPVRVDVAYETHDTDLFNDREFKIAITKGLDIPPQHHRSYLLKSGYTEGEIGGWSTDRVARAVDWFQDRHQKGLCSLAQARLLRRAGIPREKRLQMTKAEASRVLFGKGGKFSAKK